MCQEQLFKKSSPGKEKMGGGGVKLGGGSIRDFMVHFSITWKVYTQLDNRRNVSTAGWCYPIRPSITGMSAGCTGKRSVTFVQQVRLHFYCICLVLQYSSSIGSDSLSPPNSSEPPIRWLIVRMKPSSKYVVLVDEKTIVCLGSINCICTSTPLCHHNHVPYICNQHNKRAVPYGCLCLSIALSSSLKVIKMTKNEFFFVEFKSVGECRSHLDEVHGHLKNIPCPNCHLKFYTRVSVTFLRYFIN